MRMWLVNPRKMCLKHLLGEHCELHMYAGSIKVKRSHFGYFSKGLLNPYALYPRHEELVREMKRRGLEGHLTSMHVPMRDLKRELFEYSDYGATAKINKAANLRELARRCADCRKIQNGGLV